MTQDSVLVVEDDAKIRTLLRNVLEDDGFHVMEAGTANEALDVLTREQVSLVTLDLNLGSENGLEIAREVRRSSQVPIIIVSGKDDVVDRVVGLEIGADDYITKPFHVRELLARVRSVLRRSRVRVDRDLTQRKPGAGRRIDQGAHLVFDGMTAVPDRMELIDRAGCDCGLTSGDFKLLIVFLERPKRVLSRDQLMDLVNGQAHSPLDRTVDNQIARLRKKIERDPATPKLIKTVRGVGYMLACEVQVVSSSESSGKSA